MIAKKKVSTSAKASKASKPVTKNKETIYVDVDDEITHIIDRIKNSEAKIVALVLPKRANTLQSLVNMKLLKRSAVATKKNLVLITTEAGLLPLAGAAGIHVAKSLQSHPKIPKPPVSVSESEIENLDTSEDIELDKSKAIGSLDDSSRAIDDDVIEFDNIKTDDIKPAAGSKASRPKKNKKLKVPNFERFRLGIVLAVLGVLLLIGGWFLAFVVLPKATIAIKTDTTSVVSSFDFTASLAQDTVDLDSMSIPAVMKESKKTDTEKGNSTGERDEGTRARGEVTLSVDCGSGFRTSVPSGTAVSTGGLNYITQDRAILSNPGGGGGSDCRFSDTVKVVAAENGDKFNIDDGKTFSVAGFSDVTGYNSRDIDGGTSKIVKFVTQADIDQAMSRINSRQNDAIRDELASELESSRLLALKESFVSSEPKVQVTPAVNAEASEFTVSYEISYSMLGVEKGDLEQLIKKDVESEIDLDKHSIVDNGVDVAVMRVNNSRPEQAFIGFRSTVVAGPELNEDEIKENVRGKKLGEVESYIGGLTGVQDVSVDYSPFWVYTTPKAAKKITINIEKPDSLHTEGSNNNDD